MKASEIKEQYEELKALVKLYFEVKNDDGVSYEDDDEWIEILDSLELDLCILVGLISYEELDDEDSSYYS